MNTGLIDIHKFVSCGESLREDEMCFSRYMQMISRFVN